MNELNDAAQLAGALADPLRLSILHRLLEGPATVSDIVGTSGESQSKVSNHLAVLRARGLVSARRTGRQVVYRLRNPAAAHIVESLMALSGPRAARPAHDDPISLARTCYDHLAGRLGVAILDALVARHALTRGRSPDGELKLGAAGRRLFSALGVDVEPPPRSRRRTAFACLDWTERRPHLGGHLGAALCAQAAGAGWIERHANTRAVRLTPVGKRALNAALGVTLPARRR